MRLINVIADSGHLDTLASIARQHDIVDSWQGAAGEEGRIMFHMLVSDVKRQSVVDALQNVLGSSETARIIIQPVDAVLPRPAAPVEKGKKVTATGSVPFSANDCSRAMPAALQPLPPARTMGRSALSTAARKSATSMAVGCGWVSA